MSGSASTKSVRWGALVVVLIAVVAVAFRDRLGIVGWFGSSDASRVSTAPSELGAERLDRLAVPQVKAHLPLPPAAEKTDPVTLQPLTGRVIDADGVPVVGADVRLIRRNVETAFP